MHGRGRDGGQGGLVRLHRIISSTKHRPDYYKRASERAAAVSRGRRSSLPFRVQIRSMRVADVIDFFFFFLDSSLFTSLTSSRLLPDYSNGFRDFGKSYSPSCLFLRWNCKTDFMNKNCITRLQNSTKTCREACLTKCLILW